MTLTPVQLTALHAVLAPAVARLSDLERQRLDAEHDALERLHAALRGHPGGMSARKLADLTGLAVGYVHRVLEASEIVLKRRDRHPQTWWADWRDIEAGPRTFRPRGRPANRP